MPKLVLLLICLLSLFGLVKPNCGISVVFNPDDTVVLLIDYQAENINFANTTGSAAVVTKAVVQLAKRAVFLNMSVILVTFIEDNLGAVLPELIQAVPTQYTNRIMRNGTLNSWSDPAIVRAVEETKKRNILVAGLNTEIGVVAPALAARKAGYNVKVVADASGSETRTQEDVAWVRLGKGGVELTTLGAITAELVKDGTTTAAMAFAL